MFDNVPPPVAIVPEPPERSKTVKELSRADLATIGARALLIVGVVYGILTATQVIERLAADSSQLSSFGVVIAATCGAVAVIGTFAAFRTESPAPVVAFAAASIVAHLLSYSSAGRALHNSAVSAAAVFGILAAGVAVASHQKGRRQYEPT